MVRRTPRRYCSAPVLLGKKEIPRGVLEDILKLLRISEADFLSALR
jgi:hypothetical protein